MNKIVENTAPVHAAFTDKIAPHCNNNDSFLSSSYLLSLPFGTLGTIVGRLLNDSLVVT